MYTTIFCFTKNGKNLCSRLMDYFPNNKCYAKHGANENFIQIEDNMKELTEQAFKESETIIFIGAAGIAVRMIAPYIRSKDKDPAVIVLDENGKFVIPLLSGHIGGANEIASLLADNINAQAVITTATDCNNKFAVDVWAKNQGLHIVNIESIKYISSAVLNEEKIGIYSDYPIDNELPDFFTREKPESGISILKNINEKLDLPFLHTLYLIPRKYVIGVGCRKNIAPEIFEEVVLRIIKSQDIPLELVKNIASIDIKENEPAIKEFCKKFKIPFKVYNKKELEKAEGDFSHSEFVKLVVGVDNVCERAAKLSSENGKIITEKTCTNGVTVAVAEINWRCQF